MTHEWVTSGYCIGFNTNKGILLDLDNMKYRKALAIAFALCKTHRLEGFLLLRSSPKNYHAVFNRYLSWRKITKILFSRYECVRYAVYQMMGGALTLRISEKNGKNRPKIVYRVGKEDKLIKEYLEVYENDYRFSQSSMAKRAPRREITVKGGGKNACGKRTNAI